jgi:uracil phosphoribosyltransferase
VLVEHAGSVLPANQTYHVGFVRDETTLQPSMYLNKLPEHFAEGARVLVADPMLATGGTIVAAIEELTKRGVDHNLLRVVSLMAGNELCQFVSVCDPYIDCHMLIS